MVVEPAAVGIGEQECTRAPGRALLESGDETAHECLTVLDAARWMLSWTVGDDVRHGGQRSIAEIVEVTIERDDTRSQFRVVDETREREYGRVHDLRRQRRA